MNAEKIRLVIVGGDDHLVARRELQSAQRRLDRQRATGAGEGKGDSVEFRQLGFEPCDVAAIILSPRAVAQRYLQRQSNFGMGAWPVGRALRTNRRAAEQRG